MLKTHACVFCALLLHIYKKHPGYNLPTESFRHGREKTSGRAFRILSFLSSLSQRIKTDPTKLCTTFSKHGALYPRTVGMTTGCDKKDVTAFFLCCNAKKWRFRRPVFKVVFYKVVQSFHCGWAFLLPFFHSGAPALCKK